MTVYLSQGQIAFSLGNISKLFGTILAAPLGSVYLPQRQVQSCHEHDAEHSGSIKGWRFRLTKRLLAC
jgi:hypothetical protein